MENALQELIVQTGFSRDVLIAQIGMTPPKDIASAPPLPARIARPPATPVPEPENADEDVRAEELLLSLIASSRLPEDLAQEDDFRDPLLKELFLQLQSGVSAASLVESQSDEVVRARVSHLLMAQSGSNAANGARLPIADAPETSARAVRRDYEAHQNALRRRKNAGAG